MFDFINKFFNKKNSNVKKEPKTFKFSRGKTIYPIYKVNNDYYIERPTRYNKTYKWIIPTELLNEFYNNNSKHIN